MGVTACWSSSQMHDYVDAALVNANAEILNCRARIAELEEQLETVIVANLTQHFIPESFRPQPTITGKIFTRFKGPKHFSL